MKTYDWIVVGGGITGAATSYGGLAYWSGTTELTRQLCTEGTARHRILSEELDTNTQFRELDLLLTIPAQSNPEPAASYAHFAIPACLLSVAEACALEPLLNGEAIAGALTSPVQLRLINYGMSLVMN